MKNCIVGGALLVGSLVSGAHGQTGHYYLTDENGFNRVWQVNGGSLVNAFGTVPNSAHGPILIDGPIVRTIEGFSGGGTIYNGSEYSLGGTPGAPLTLDTTAWGGMGRVVDAGFDGGRSYIVDSNGRVFQYGNDFSGSGNFMFGAAPADQGITFDTLTGTIWTSNYGDGRVRQWDLAGNLLFAFGVVDNQGVLSTNNTALAYDSSDDTFWLNAHRQPNSSGILGMLWQFDRNGNFLQSVEPLPGTDILFWGGEITPRIPAPGAFGLAGIAGILAARRRRS